MTAFVWLVIGLLAAAHLVTLITTASEEVDRHVRAALDIEADDWALFPAPEFADTPIYADLRHEQDVLFMAEVLADIDELPGGAA